MHIIMQSYLPYPIPFPSFVRQSTSARDAIFNLFPGNVTLGRFSVYYVYSHTMSSFLVIEVMGFSLRDP